MNGIKLYRNIAHLYESLDVARYLCAHIPYDNLFTMKAFDLPIFAPASIALLLDRE